MTTMEAVAMRKERDRAEQENDSEAWLHYEDLRQAFIALRSSK